jgi:hypothetical protein
MTCNSKSETLDIDRSTLISDMTMAAVLDLTTEIEAYERMYPEKSEDEVLKLIRSKRWYYAAKRPELASWNDWFVIMVINGVCENLSFYQIKISDEEQKFVENLIYKIMNEFPCWKSKGGYYRQRIGFRQLIT